MSKQLTFADKQYIQSNYLQKTDEELADELSTSVKVIKNYRTENNLLKNASKTVNSESSRLMKMRKDFEKSQRFINLQRNLSSEDLIYFTDLWVQYQDQFEDLSPTEEDTLEIMILTKLRIDENVRNTTDCLRYEAELKKKLGTRVEKELDLENEADRFLFEHIASNNRLKQDLNKDYRESVNKFESIQESLAATRQQREQKEHIGADTILGLIKQMNDRDIRAAAGRYNELMRKASENQKIKHSKEHKLSDGSEAQLLMSGKDDFIPKEPVVEERKDDEQT